MSKSHIPTKIERIPQRGLSITWSDGAQALIANQTLRQECPCATCKEARGEDTHAAPLGGPKLGAKKSMLKVIEHELNETIDLQQVWGIGQYAIGLQWGDGHNTGIYTFEYLAELSMRTK